MGIKVSYVILKTLSTVLNLPFKAINGFELNNFLPISANKSVSFVYENGNIVLKKAKSTALKLPQNLSKINKSNDTIPNYVISAV